MCSYQNHGLDILKFVMAIVVVSIHAELFKENDMLFKGVQPIKMVAVPCFFTISSYLFFRKIAQYEQLEKGDSLKAETRILLHYLFRLMVFYLFWFVVMLPMTIFVRKWNQHFDIIIFFKSFLLDSTFRGSFFIMVLIIGVPIVFYLRRIIHPITVMFISFAVYLIFQYPDMLDIKYCTWVRNGSLHYSFIPHIVWISIGCVLAICKTNFNCKMISTTIFIVLLYSLMLHSVYEPLLRPAFCITIFILFYHLGTKEKQVYYLMRQLSIVVFVIHFLFLSIYVHIGVYYFPALNNSIICFFVILICSLLSSLSIILIKQKKGFGWLKYGL